MLALTQLSNNLTLKGSFSAVSKPNFAINYAIQSLGPSNWVTFIHPSIHRNQILQVNTRWKALAEIYKIIVKMHSFAPVSNLKISLKIAELFAVFFQNFAN